LDLFTAKLSEGSLDRRKMELICQKILKEQQYADRLGNQLLLFRGRGGPGRLCVCCKSLGHYTKHPETGFCFLHTTRRWYPTCAGCSLSWE
jgi:hypothetical protein